MGPERGSGSPPAPPVALARRIEASAQPGDDFTYSVAPPERRGFHRQRTRLRSGKLVRQDGQFLSECLVSNLSASGCRLKLPSATLDLAPGVYFYDDQTELLFQGRVAWKSGRELGLKLRPCAPSPLHISIVGAMRRKFYAVRR